MNYQKLRESFLFWLGGISYLACYAVFSIVKVISQNIKDITGLYLLIPFAFLIFASFVITIVLLYKSVKACLNNTEKQHNYPFWLSVWGDMGYACLIYTLLDLFFKLANIF